MTVEATNCHRAYAALAAMLALVACSTPAPEPSGLSLCLVRVEELKAENDDLKTEIALLKTTPREEKRTAKSLMPNFKDEIQ
jgi:hypothetical protein